MNKEQIKQERSRLGLTISDMAKRIGVSVRAYSYYESGQRSISLPIQKLIELQRKLESIEREGGK